MVRQLLARHPEAIILNGEGAGLVIGGDVDFQGQLFVVDGGTGQLMVAQFFERVTGIGDQFPDEDLLVRVERVNDDIQQLPGFRLEGVRFRLRMAHDSLGSKG